MQRILYPKIIASIQQQKISLISGPKKSGKSEMIFDALAELDLTYFSANVSQKKEKDLLKNIQIEELKTLVCNAKCLVILEAQHLENLQQIIDWILNDELNISLIISCSSQAQIDEIFLEALRIENLEINVCPLTFYELTKNYSLAEIDKKLEHYLIYGQFPEIIESPNDREKLLLNMVDEIIDTQITSNDRINKREKLMRLLTFVAFQIGNAISFNEIGEKCDLDNETAERYVKLLAKVGILILLPSFHNKQKYELKKSNLIYFMDNGLRNAFIRNFNEVAFRNDIDVLWKNWIVAERVKWNLIHNQTKSFQFWKTHTAQIIDFIESDSSQTMALKIEWNKKKKTKVPSQFTQSYPAIKTNIVNRSTYWSFITKK